MADQKDIESASRSALKGADISSKAISAMADAIFRFLESRSFVSREAKILADHVKKGGQLGCVTMSPSSLKEFKQMLQDEKIASTAIKFEQGDGSHRYGLIFNKEDQKRVEQLREKYLASKHLVFNISKENLEGFAKGRVLHEYSNLTYAEMCNLKERMVQNQIMFSAKKHEMNSYSIFVRKEDKEITDLLRSGVKQEREGTGKNIYEQSDHERENRENIINRVMADKEATFLVGNHDNTKILYSDKEGLWYEQEGSYAKREFISKADDRFEEKLCEYIDRIRNPRVLKKTLDKEAENMFKEQFQKGPEKDDVIKMSRAMELYGIHNLKELQKIDHLKTPDERLNELGRRGAKDRNEYEAAYCRLRSAIDLSHTEKDNGLIYVSEAERQAFKAEQELRKQYEYCVIRGYDGKGSFAEQYKQESMEKEQMEVSVKHIQEEKHFTVDDMRRNIVWREAYEMPDYVDKDRDGIFDEFDQDIGAKEKAEQNIDHDMPEEQR